MSEFDRPLVGFRLADTLHGDTLQLIAARELGDPARWVDLANINELLPPYVTDDPALASSRVLLSGSVIIVPAQTPVSETSQSTDPDSVYELDLGLIGGHLSANENGDFQVFTGRDNLRQALVHRVVTERGELLWHPEYGALIRSLIGVVNGPTASTLAAKYAEATLRADPRVREVASVIAEVSGDIISVSATVVPITGQSTKIEAVI